MANNSESDVTLKEEPKGDYKVEEETSDDRLNYPEQGPSALEGEASDSSLGDTQPILEHGSARIASPPGVKDECMCAEEKPHLEDSWQPPQGDVSAGREPYSSKIHQQQVQQEGGSFEDQSRPYTCYLCEYSFTNSTNLKRHMLIHSGEKPFACDLCDFRSTHAGNLKIHMRTHSTVKPHMCTLCDYKCKHPGSLKLHMMTHTGEKPYACTVCDFKFTQAINLRNHMRIHTGEKPYACTVCDHRFTQSIHLKNHMVIHTGEKPYACSTCDYRCSLVHQLKAHMRTHQGMES